MNIKLLIIGPGNGKYIGAIRTGKTHFTFISFIRLTNSITIAALEEYDVRNSTIMAAISCTRYTCVYLLLD